MSDPTVDKKRRYDRQLRIWGEQGQARLESARVCLLNCGPTGTEALKNLVLGGIAAFTLVDGGKVTAADLGNNFLVLASALGTSRAACVAALLKELNDAVAGAYVEEEPAALLAADPAFFKDFTLVIATQMREEQVVALDAACREYGVPLIAARSYGLVGHVRLSVAEHTVVESKPDNAPEDLRVGACWPALADYCAAFDLEGCDDAAHHHVPYLVLLVRALAAWRSAHGGAPPGTAPERAAFKEALRGMAREHGQENVKEALAAAHKAWALHGVPHDARAVLDDPAAHAAATAATPDFWVLAAAVRAFVAAEGGGALPLDGAIPDMTASTDAYVALQRLFVARAAADTEAVEAHAGAILRAAGRPAGAITRDAVRAFCKHAAHLAVVRIPPLSAEVGAPGARGAALGRALAAEDCQRGNAVLYVLLRAADRFAQQYGRYPGALDSALEEDVARLKAAAAALLAEYGPAAAGTALPDDLVAELCRFGAAELHCVAAVVGGMAAQEAIKLITHQFVPLAAPLIYNAMDSTTTVLQLV